MAWSPGDIFVYISSVSSERLYNDCKDRGIRYKFIKSKYSSFFQPRVSIYKKNSFSIKSKKDSLQENQSYIFFSVNNVLISFAFIILIIFFSIMEILCILKCKFITFSTFKNNDYVFTNIFKSQISFDSNLIHRLEAHSKLVVKRLLSLLNLSFVIYVINR